MKKEIKTNNAPLPVGPYSQAIMTENLIFLSGQIGINPKTGKLVEGGVEEQTKQIFSNIKAVLEEVKLNLSNIVKVSVFLKDMSDFKRVNEIYAKYFDKPYPARSAIAVKELPLNVDIEIEVIAIK